MRPLRIRKSTGLRILGLALAFGLTAGGLSASAASPAPGAQANFKGQSLNLTEGWDGAAGCLVLSATAVECFGSIAALQNAEAIIGLSGTDSVCGGGFLKLYQNEGFGGTEIDFANVDYWVNLSDYGFGNEMSSWKNTSSCVGYGAKGSNGSGAQLTMPADSQNSWVGTSWNDALNSVELVD